MDLDQIRARARARHDALAAAAAIARHRAATLAAEIAAAETAQRRGLARADALAAAIAAVNAMVAAIATANLARVESVVNLALRAVFVDKGLTWRIEHEVKRNQTMHRFVLASGGVEGSLHSFGYGVFAVIALVLKVLFNRLAGGYPLVVLDEQLPNVSAEYRARASRLLHLLAHDLAMPILVVTHEPGFLAAADRRYEIVPAPATSGPGATLRALPPA